MGRTPVAFRPFLNVVLRVMAADNGRDLMYNFARADIKMQDKCYIIRTLEQGHTKIVRAPMEGSVLEAEVE